MLVSTDEKVIVANLGWVDKGNLWCLHTSSHKIKSINLSAAKYLTLHKLFKSDYFSVMHHFGAEKVLITAHNFDDISNKISTIIIDKSGSKIEGEKSVWSKLPKVYVCFLDVNDKKDDYLIQVDSSRSDLRLVKLDWYDDSYDKDYQGLIDVTEVPQRKQLIFTIQRNSYPVLYDMHKQSIIKKISLADRGGNPQLFFRKNKSELWASDYDNMLVIDADNWNIKFCGQLQKTQKGIARFIGDYTFNEEETLCAVARPFSGDVIVLDTKNFQIAYGCKLNDQPLSVALLSNGKVYARDWKTGKLLRGIPTAIKHL